MFTPELLTMKGQEEAGLWQFDLSSVSYDSKSFDTSTQDSYPYSIDFNADGTKMYVLGFITDTVYEYDLSTAGDVSTAVYNSVSLYVGSRDGQPMKIHFVPDGSIMYYLGQNNKTIYQYTLSTPWSLSTASYSGYSRNVSSYTGTYGGGLFLNLDGTVMYYIRTTGDQIDWWDLSTPYRISTAVLDASIYKYVGSEAGSPSGIIFSGDGFKMFVGDYVDKKIFEYDLSTAWDISTATYNSVSHTFTEFGGYNMRDFAVLQDGTKLYAIHREGSTIYQYSL